MPRQTGTNGRTRVPMTLHGLAEAFTGRTRAPSRTSDACLRNGDVSEAESWLEAGLDSEGVGEELERLCAAAAPAQFPVAKADAFVDPPILVYADQTRTFGKDGVETMVIKPAEIRFAHNGLQPLFTCGRSVREVAESLKVGSICPKSLPMIKVVSHEGKMYSVNNRRPFCLQFAEVEEVQTIVGAPDEHFFRGLNTKTDGRIPFTYLCREGRQGLFSE